VTANKIEEAKRPYQLGKRLEQMDESRAAVLRAARTQLENGYWKMTMSSLAAESGITRQTVHNLFGTKGAVLEALFDVIALEGGMENMRDVMTQGSAEKLLERFVEVFCHFWTANRLLIRRIHGIGAIDPEFGSVVEARNRRRFLAAKRVVSRLGIHQRAEQRAAALAALTSFEFFDALVDNSPDENVTETILDLSRKMLSEH
jgi:AcrR family transcriptional regulator